MKTKLYLIRHGQSQGNVDKIFQGQNDCSLSEMGRLQAEKAAEFLKGIKPDAIYSSDLIRAVETASPTASFWKMPIQTRIGLREIDAGKWSGLPYDTIAATCKKSWDSWKTDPDNAFCEGGETVKELTERISREVLKLGEENQGKTLFVFSHATAIRALALYCGYRKRISEIPSPKNASASLFIYENGSLALDFYSFDKYMQGFVTGAFKE